MSAPMPRATPVREDDSALVRVLEAHIETLKAENEILTRRLEAAETRAAEEIAKADGAIADLFGGHAAQVAGGRPWRRQGRVEDRPRLAAPWWRRLVG
jgi:hypothetical protein